MNKRKPTGAVRGSDRLVRRLEWLRDEAQTKASAAAEETADQVRAETQETLRRAPGNLPRLAETVDTDGEGPERSVVVRHPAAPFVEYGTRRLPPRPFMQPAADRARKTLPSRIKSALGRLLRVRP